jgi:hypothetical protein
MLEDDGVTNTVGVAFVIPVPVKATMKGLPVALLDTVKVPVLCTAEEGEKVTLIAQVAFGARLEAQLFVWLKLLEAEKPSNCNAVPPVFPIVRIIGELAVPMSWPPNSMELLDAAIEGPEGTRVMTRGTPGEVE